MKLEQEAKVLQAAEELPQPFTTDEALRSAKVKINQISRRRATELLAARGWSRASARRPHERGTIKGWSRPAQLKDPNQGEQGAADAAVYDPALHIRQLEQENIWLRRNQDQLAATTRLYCEQVTSFQERWAGALLAGGFIPARAVMDLVNREQATTNSGLRAIERLGAERVQRNAIDAARENGGAPGNDMG